jgi:tRNA1Val (adenine37-N6)-methyltransferase
MKKVEPVHLPGPMDWVVSNPPYRKAAAGRLNPHPQRAVARHEIKVTLPDVIATACRVLRKGGKFVAVYASDRMAEALHGMHVAGIEPKFCRMIHSDRTADAKLALVEGVKGAHPGMVVASPLFLHHKDGSYTSAAQKLFRP